MRQPTNNAIQEGRGKNAVARLFMESLIVPKVFFDARWPNRGNVVDVLAVNRSGAGDLYIAEIALDYAVAKQKVAKLHLMPAHFKYLALFNTDAFFSEEDPDPSLYAPDGLGRIGLISLCEGDPGSAMRAETAVEPERFRIGSDIFEAVDRFVKAHEPDILVRA